MITINRYPKTRGGRPSAWYAADWLRAKAYVYRTKLEATRKARELNSNGLGHIVNVDWLDTKTSYDRRECGKVARRKATLQDLIGRSFKIFDCRA